MIIGHISDNHGKLRHIEAHAAVDVWVISGDFFPNYGRPIIAVQEAAYQRRWYYSNEAQILAALGDTPVVWCPGNHDFVDLAELLRESGKDNVYSVTPEGVVVAGRRFSGFREVPAMMYEWQGETMDFADLITRTLDSQPDIIVTHAPLKGMLDNGGSRHERGIPSMLNRLAFGAYNLRAHLCGHAHNDGGKQVEEMGIVFSNAAEHINTIEI